MKGYFHLKRTNLVMSTTKILPNDNQSIFQSNLLLLFYKKDDASPVFEQGNKNTKLRKG